MWDDGAAFSGSGACRGGLFKYVVVVVGTHVTNDGGDTATRLSLTFVAKGDEEPIG